MGGLFEKMMNFLPEYWHSNHDMIQILQTIADEIVLLHAKYQIIYTNAFILIASESRVREWEKDLKIQPIGSLYQRRLFILSKLRGNGKLNEVSIKSIVSSFTGGYDCIVTFSNSTITVRILPPNNGEVFVFSDIIRTITPRKPAHLGLVVKRYYSTWGDIKDQFTSWQDLNDSKTDWNAVKNHIER